MTRLFLWRHGQTEWNFNRRFQGQYDADLSEVGHAQAAEAARLLAAREPDALVTSDLRRAADTAAVLAKLTGLTARTDVRLRERHFGEWQGRTMAEIEERWPDEVARWRAGEPSPGAGIEEHAGFALRMGEVLRELAAEYPDGTVVVTTHGGSAREGVGELLGWSPAVRRTLGVLHNCHWAELRDSGGGLGWRLHAYNVG